MDPSRKRKIRLVVALCAALLLGGALIYTSFNDSTEAKTPSQIAGERSSASFEVTGRVVAGSGAPRGRPLPFSVRGRNGTGAGPPPPLARAAAAPPPEGGGGVAEGPPRRGA